MSWVRAPDAWHAALGDRAGRRHRSPPRADLATIAAIDHTSGYRAPMRAALDRVPLGAIVGSLQSGALGYYAPPDVQVVNLDRVVDPGAARALAAYDLDAYAASRAVRYFCDWPFRHELYRKRAGRSVRFEEL